jgi:hypothetical protein
MTHRPVDNGPAVVGGQADFAAGLVEPDELDELLEDELEEVSDAEPEVFAAESPEEVDSAAGFVADVDLPLPAAARLSLR